jgi:hypothetical protein
MPLTPPSCEIDGAIKSISSRNKEAEVKKIINKNGNNNKNLKDSFHHLFPSSSLAKQSPHDYF